MRNVKRRLVPGEGGGTRSERVSCSARAQVRVVRVRLEMCSWKTRAEPLSETTHDCGVRAGAGEGRGSISCTRRIRLCTCLVPRTFRQEVQRTKYVVSVTTDFQMIFELTRKRVCYRHESVRRTFTATTLLIDSDVLRSNVPVCSGSPWIECAPPAFEGSPLCSIWDY